MKTPFLCAALVVLFSTASFVATFETASARGYHRTSRAQNSNGRGYVKHVDRNCGGGTCTGHRSVQTHGGYGYTADHSRSCANGSCNSTSSVTGNNGDIRTRSRGITNNGDGSASWYSNASGPNGSISRSGTATRND